METQPELGDFLRAARSRVRPEEVALTDPASLARARRVKGLRREEVAALAGVSVDYYTRLEQGRAGQVSAGVLTGVARALRLNETEQAYFFALAADAPAVAPDGPSLPQRVRPGVHLVLESMVDNPALVHGPGLQVLAMNELAKRILFDIDAVPHRERNLARWVFLAPEARERYVDWELVASETAAVLRVDAGLHPRDRALMELIGELTVHSPEFQEMWAEHRVHECTWGTKRLRHPLVGDYEVTYEAFEVPGADGQRLKVYTAEPGSPSADALRLIGAWTQG